jgi:hypothetical protein
MDGDSDWNLVAINLILLIVIFGLCYSFVKHHGGKKIRFRDSRGFEVVASAPRTEAQPDAGAPPTASASQAVPPDPRGDAK